MSISENPSIEKMTQRLIATLRSEVVDLTENQLGANKKQIAELVRQHGSQTSEIDITAIAETISSQAAHSPSRLLE